MAVRRKAVIRVAWFLFCIIVLYNGITFVTDSLKTRNIYETVSGNYPSKEILRNLFLGEEQCRATFPGLMKEIDDVVARGPFELEKEPDDYTGMVQARIKDGKVNPACFTNWTSEATLDSCILSPQNIDQIETWDL